MKGKRFWLLLVLGGAVLSGCTLQSGRDYQVVPAWDGVAVNISAGPTRMIETQLVPACHEQPVCVANWLSSNVQLDDPFYQPLWLRGLANYNDLWTNALLPAARDHTQCPAMHIDRTRRIIGWQTHPCRW